MPAGMKAAAKASKPPRRRVMGWTTMAQLQLHVTGHDRRLMVAVSDGSASSGVIGWIVLASETPLASNSTEAVLDSHSHQALPTQRTLGAAVAFAEKYAAYWQKNRVTALECTCGAIEASP